MKQQEKALFNSNIERIKELEKKLAEAEKINSQIKDKNIELQSKNKAIQKENKDYQDKIDKLEIRIKDQSSIISIQENTIKEQKETIDTVKTYLIESKLMKTKLINQLFGKSSAKTKNLIAQELEKDSSLKNTLKKEKDTSSNKRGRTLGKHNFDDWKSDFFLNEEKIIDIDAYINSECSSCGSSEWVITGYDETIKLSLIPQRIKRTKYKFPILQCKNCKDKIRTYKDLDCFNRLSCTPSLAGFLSMLSCGLYLPYKRIEDYFEYAGTPLSRELITKYCITTGVLLNDFVSGTFHEEMMKSDVLHLDETVAYNLEDKEYGTNRIWGATTGKEDKIQASYYLYSKDRKHVNFLGGVENDETYEGLISKDYKGTIVTDSYPAYMCDIDHSLCWSHLRKYIFDYLQANQNENSKDYQEMKELLDKINEIFTMERSFDKLSSEERTKERHDKLKPLMEEYFTMAEKIYNPKIDDMKNTAINYGLKNKELFMTLIDNGDIPLTNNKAEVSMRKYVMKRVASMFSTSTKGIKSTCVLLTLVQSARMNRLQPDAYIQYLLENIEELKDKKLSKNYLPWSSSIPDKLKLDEEEYKQAEIEVEKELKKK